MPQPVDNDRAWELVVERLDLINGQVGRFYTLKEPWTQEDLWPYAVEAVFQAIRKGHLDTPLLKVIAYRGAVDGYRELQGLDGWTRKDRELKVRPRDFVESILKEPEGTIVEPVTEDTHPGLTLRDISQLRYPLNAILALSWSGWEKQQIAKLFQVSPSRISQIVAEYRRRLNARPAPPQDGPGC